MKTQDNSKSKSKGAVAQPPPSLSSTFTPAVYEAPGLLEFTLTLPADAPVRAVCFEGGSISGFGIRAARLTCRDAAVAVAVEASPAFASGKIRKI